MTIDLIISMSACNPAKLLTELQAALTTKFDSLNTFGSGQPVLVRLTNAATGSDQTTAQNVCAAHDASLTAKQAFAAEQSPLVDYYSAIILQFYQDVDNGGVTMIQMLTNAANLVAVNATQAAKFNAYRTRLGLGGAIGSMTATQQGNLLVLGLEWAAAGLAVARGL